MPVPVPPSLRPSPHPVFKTAHHHHQLDQSDSALFFPSTLPLSPVGPPPSFSTREEWIKSLPHWRRTKPRRIWEEDKPRSEQRSGRCFSKGLTVAGNASVIKGSHAEARIPPHRPLFDVSSLWTDVPADLIPSTEGDSEDEMSSDCSALDQVLCDNQSQWSSTSPAVGHDDDSLMLDSDDIPELAYPPAGYEKGAFSPIFEDDSPSATNGHEAASSPLGPITPFGDFVDRIVATSQDDVRYDNIYMGGIPHHEGATQDSQCGPQCYEPAQPQQAPSNAQEQPKEPEVVVPTASSNYRKLTEPLSEWLANYVWKTCTTGMYLPPVFAQPGGPIIRSYQSAPPAHLASQIQFILLSTLLQPSAIFLAIWYIVRLPIYFGAGELPEEYAKESEFRRALFENLDQDGVEAHVPFRLVILGCMFANKWLDDHTFSNKTWQSISGVPVTTLNRLEQLALEIFNYDLCVPALAWSQWLTHLQSYHMSLNPTNRIQPISRPSSNPHALVRKTIDEIIQAQAALDGSSSVPRPVFLGLEERLRERAEREHHAMEVEEIDLDKDGPLREEYAPRRRGATNSFSIHGWEGRGADVTKALPPPAKWSPSNDEPILRDANRGRGHYIAVQAPYMAPIPSFVAPYPQQLHDGSYQAAQWPGNGSVAGKLPPPPPPGYPFDYPSYHVPSIYNPMMGSHHNSHSRAQSLSYDQEYAQPRNHMRTYPQNRYEYHYNDTHFVAPELIHQHPDVESRWAVTGHQGVAHTFGAHPLAAYHAPWIRT